MAFGCMPARGTRGWNCSRRRVTRRRHRAGQVTRTRWRRHAATALRKPANRKLAISLTAEQFRYGFGNMLPEQESAELYDRWTVPSPAKPLFEAAQANFTPRSPAKVNTANKTRGPLLLTAGG